MSANPGRFGRSKKFGAWTSALFAAVVIATLGLSVVSSSTQTELIEPDKFDGIWPLRKSTTNIIIVHGIGQHCIGYADKLISDLLTPLSGSPSETIKDSYIKYVEKTGYGLPGKVAINAPKSKTESYQVQMVEPLRDGNCNRVNLPKDVVKGRQVNTGEDLDSVVIGQDELCRSINQSEKGGQTQTYCHKFYVDRVDEEAKTENPDDNPEYVTGFVRRFDALAVADRRVRIYEVTWSPATRWIKQTLRDVELFNDAMSAHPLNRILKTEVVNTGVADAVAYLSDSGILVNYNILQTFCLTLANHQLEPSSFDKYPFVCNKSHLKDSPKAFSESNDVVLISHSLGTRILFDSIGLLSRGVNHREGNSARARPPDLVTMIRDKFERIGAKFPNDKQTAAGSEPDFAALLSQKIPEFARAVKSVYLFTNQLPLLAANLSSPFKKDYGVSDGFSEFLDLRARQPANATNSASKPADTTNTSRPADATNSAFNLRLQVVAFHDPDDILSYNLGCWYYEAVLKQLPETKIRLNEEAQHRAKIKKSDFGEERRNLRDTMFARNCSQRNLVTPADKQLFADIWASNANLLDLKNATVRLRGHRVQWIAADPLGVHSNYFHDDLVHKWLVNGYPGKGSAKNARE